MHMRPLCSSPCTGTLLHHLRVNRCDSGKALRRGRFSTLHYLSSREPTWGRTTQDCVPFRKQLKEEAEARRLERVKKGKQENGTARLEEWELTVGIEIHAQLNTDAKLFSSKRLRRIWVVPLLTMCIAASTSVNDVPNTNVALFDLAIPGSQPVSIFEDSISSRYLLRVRNFNRLR